MKCFRNNTLTMKQSKSLRTVRISGLERILVFNRNNLICSRKIMSYFNNIFSQFSPLLFTVNFIYGHISFGIIQPDFFFLLSGLVEYYLFIKYINGEYFVNKILIEIQDHRN